MKFTSLSSAAIIAALTIGALAPTAAVAAPEELDSIGSVKVEEGGTDPDEEIDTVDPENPDETLPEPDPDGPDEIVNPDIGPLMIERVSSLEFGSIKTSANEVKTFASPMNYGEAGTRGNFVQWRDIRAGGMFGYTLTAEMTQQFTGESSNTLNGSTIDFSNGFMTAQGDNTNNAPSTINSDFQLTEDGGAQTIVTASQEEQEGKGRYIMAFGNSADSTADESILLTVPAATASNMAIGDYTAKVTWKVVAAQ
ncbi:WxL domain-containing protein [Candidatus Enterococcus ikei]|uniref:WxL domain-containing protein n=1 Tax=Candidatus Enterococcus ikei TaxID=2815326 RepID=A0ABS3H223_9ENTE|nr:WxL domain-containing protein [Enterococcus sp. DIV0869a]MBO0441224.1 WxL domain-containing protein [Enterococcus sp. DIV0869a]